MNRFPIVVMVLAGLLVAQGCQSIKPNRAGADGPGAAAIALPFPEPEQVARELDEDLVFSYLVGEIGAHRGELRLAQTHYQHAAVLGQDAYAAERSTRIALHLRDYPAGLTAAQRWVTLAPNDLAARQLAAVLFFRNEQPEAAGEQLDALIQVADARGIDGFLQAAGVFSVESDRAAAEQLMQGLHERHPDDRRSLYALAVLELAHRRLPEAEARLRTVIADKSDWEQPRVLLSRVLVAQKRRDEALELLDASVRRYPDSTLLRTTYARMLVDANDYSASLKQFRELNERQPDDEELLFGYAMLATQQERWKEARPAWQKLRKRSERRAEATYYLAQIEQQNENHDLAIELFRAVEGGQFKVDAAIRAAQIFGSTDRLAEARGELQRARIANPVRAADLYVAETLIIQNNGTREDALALYETALTAYPENEDLLYNRALFVIQKGDLAAMERDLQRLLQKNPDNADALNALGYTLADSNQRLDEAFTLVSRALELAPESPAILDSMGWVLYRQGDLEGAADYLQRALKLSRRDDEIAAHLGEVLWMSGERADAQAVWREALKHTPDSEKIRSVLERLQADL